MASGEVSGLEALVRWDHPTRGAITPADFIPVAEQTGLIRPLTSFVLDEALGWVRAWRDDDLELPVAVNLSTRSLTDDGLPADVERLLHKHGITPDYLTFEITETSVVADADQTNGVLHRLRALGVRLSIDDFGTGYSSLVYLKRLAVDELKVDQSFVRDMTRDAND